MFDFEKLRGYVKKALENDKSGHEYAHVLRVEKTAFEIVKNYPNANKEVLLLACLLHDIAFKDGWVENHHLAGAQLAEEILTRFGYPIEKIHLVQMCIEDHCGMIVKPVREDSKLCIESKILRDADNMDAFGAIGIIRQTSFCTTNSIPYFKSNKDILNESIYGGMKEIVTWADKMLTLEGRRMAERRLPVMIDWIKEIEDEYAQ